MPIRFPCPHCRTVIALEEQYAGYAGPCPHCGQPAAAPPPAVTRDAPRARGGNGALFAAGGLALMLLVTLVLAGVGQSGHASGERTPEPAPAPEATAPRESGPASSPPPSPTPTTTPPTTSSPAPASPPTATKEGFIREAVTVTARDLLREREQYLQGKVTFTGKVDEDVEKDYQVTLIVDTTRRDAVWQDPAYVTFKRSASGPRVLAGDYVRVYGYFTGVSVFSGGSYVEETMPEIDLVYYKVLDPTTVEPSP